MKGIFMDSTNCITDIKELKKWSCIPEEYRKRIIDNVFCGKCGVTTIVDYSITSDKYGILLKGKCKKCGHEVARLVENE
jgi:ribosomal protein S27AE